MNTKKQPGRKKAVLSWMLVIAALCAAAVVCLQAKPLTGILTNESEITSAVYYKGSEEVRLTADAAKALESAVNRARAAAFPAKLDPPQTIIRWVTICHEDGTSYLVHYQPKHISLLSILHNLSGYAMLVTEFRPDGTQTTWQLEYDFDQTFNLWKSQWINGNPHIS